MGGKRARATLVLGTIFALLLWTPHRGGTQIGQGVVDAEALKAGDKWVYKRASGGEYEVSVTDVVAGEYVTEVSSLPGVKLYRDQNWTVTRIEGKLERGDPRNFVGWRWLDVPMGPGKKFSYKTDSSFGPVDVDAVVGKWEKVTVPAGTFDALRIEGCWRNRDKSWAPCGQLRWYSPEVGTFIKQLSPRQSFGQMADFDFELVRFTRGR
jgi:hypothetical protein